MVMERITPSDKFLERHLFVGYLWGFALLIVGLLVLSIVVGTVVWVASAALGR